MVRIFLNITYQLSAAGHGVDDGTVRRLADRPSLLEHGKLGRKTAGRRSGPARNQAGCRAMKHPAMQGHCPVVKEPILHTFLVTK